LIGLKSVFPFPAIFSPISVSKQPNRSDGANHYTICECYSQEQTLPHDPKKPTLLILFTDLSLVHHHPSGDPSPSKSDTRLTRRVADAARVLQIHFLDHVVGLKGQLQQNSMSIRHHPQLFRADGRDRAGFSHNKHELIDGYRKQTY
jgi:hypothetical protein